MCSTWIEEYTYSNINRRYCDIYSVSRKSQTIFAISRNAGDFMTITRHCFAIPAVSGIWGSKKEAFQVTIIRNESDWWNTHSKIYIRYQKRAGYIVRPRVDDRFLDKRKYFKFQILSLLLRCPHGRTFTFTFLIHVPYILLSPDTLKLLCANVCCYYLIAIRTFCHDSVESRHLSMYCVEST